jgi:hypothetical protein
VTPRRSGILGAVLLLALVGAPLAPAEDVAPAGKQAETAKPKRKVHIKDTVKEGAKTGGRTARDGILTFGRTTRDFFKGGTSAAKKTWHENAAKTKRTAREGAESTRDAAHK